MIVMQSRGWLDALELFNPLQLESIARYPRSDYPEGWPFNESYPSQGSDEFPLLTRRGYYPFVVMTVWGFPARARLIVHSYGQYKWVILEERRTYAPNLENEIDSAHVAGWCRLQRAEWQDPLF